MPAQRPFRFGIINEQMGDAARWAARARHAEALGYATFLLRDHFVAEPFGDQFAPFVALTAAACATTRLRVGTLVFGNDYRHPVILAKEAATLDLLSGGRLELGIGAGWLRAEYDAAGMAYEPNGVRVDRLAEALTVIKGLFADGPLTFNGAHYRVTDLNSFPKPTQRPGPPFLIGAGKRRMLQLAGQHADIVGFLTTSVASGALHDDPTERLAAAVEQKIAWVRAGAGARFDTIELSLIPSIIITDDRQGATEQFIREHGWSGITPEQVWAMPAVLIGTVAEIIETLQVRRERYGFSYYVIADAQIDACAPLVSALAGR
ncbi:MAG TPA: TIGR03621 family F420-dependent LLM class oxidoreductase [Thermomicrobiales bacterium]|jgi:probable F420-dependent oxidoreductase